MTLEGTSTVTIAVLDLLLYHTTMLVQKNDNIWDLDKICQDLPVSNSIAVLDLLLYHTTMLVVQKNDKIWDIDQICQDLPVSNSMTDMCSMYAKYAYLVDLVP